MFLVKQKARLMQVNHIINTFTVIMQQLDTHKHRYFTSDYN